MQWALWRAWLETIRRNKSGSAYTGPAGRTLQLVRVSDSTRLLSAPADISSGTVCGDKLRWDPSESESLPQRQSVRHRKLSVWNELPEETRGDNCQPGGRKGETLSNSLMNDCLISIKRSHKALALSLSKHCHDKGMLRERGRDVGAERGMRTVKRSEREPEKRKTCKFSPSLSVVSWAFPGEE